MKTKTKWTIVAVVAALPALAVGSLVLSFMDLRPRWYIEWKRNRPSAVAERQRISQRPRGPMSAEELAAKQALYEQRTAEKARETGLQGIYFG